MGGPFRRKRRPDDGKFLPADEKAWRSLIQAARYQARTPLASTDPLTRASARCVRAGLPLGERHRASVFLKLIALARGFWRFEELERQTRSPDLALLADACQAVLDRPASVSERPPRRDIFG